MDAEPDTDTSILCMAWLQVIQAIHVKTFAGRMWLGRAREHYASEISDRKLR